ncbi:DUF3126 family protein [Rhodovibrionaceae bacterium A322]
MKVTEIQRVQAYLRGKFGTERISVHGRSGKDDSAEVNLGEEFIGVIFRDDEEGEVSYDFHMTILDIDLPDV